MESGIKQKQMLEDSKGNISSKRVWGNRLFIIGIIFASILFGISVFLEAKDAATAIDIVGMFFYSGTGLLGLGVAEHFRLGDKK